MLPSDHTTKQALRAWAKKQRALQTPEQRVILGQQICQHIERWVVYQQAKHILFYSATPSELDVMSLAASGDRTFYLTRTWEKSKDLTIHFFDKDRLETHPYGYQQPHRNSPRVLPNRIDMVLVPGLVFSSRGERLGYGGGYYDRLLARMPQAHFVAIVQATLCFKQFPVGFTESHDISMHHIVTEDGIVNCD